MNEKLEWARTIESLPLGSSDFNKLRKRFKEIYGANTSDYFTLEEREKLRSETSLNNDFIQDCIKNLSEFWIDADRNLCYRQRCLGKIKQS